MGQSLKKLVPGSEENKEKEIGPTIEECYNKYFKESPKKESSSPKEKTHGPESWNSDSNLPAPTVCEIPEDRPTPSLAHFYRAVCDTVAEINMKFDSTQIRLPNSEKLKEVYDVHFGGGRSELTKQDFQKILQETIIYSGFTGVKSNNILYFIFGIPITALMIKQRIGPKALPNDLFIPVVTSATVFLLAKLNKI